MADYLPIIRQPVGPSPKREALRTGDPETSIRRAGTCPAEEYGQEGESGEIPELARNCKPLACTGLVTALRQHEG